MNKIINLTYSTQISLDNNIVISNMSYSIPKSFSIQFLYDPPVKIGDFCNFPLFFSVFVPSPGGQMCVSTV